jgi:hypothetical protein
MSEFCLMKQNKLYINQLFNTNMSMEPTDNQASACCPPFASESWDNKFFEWNEKKFIRDKVFTFFYMPIGFGKVMKRMELQVKKAGASIPDFLCLSDHTSKWNMDVYLCVDKEIQDADNIKLSGKFFSKVYEGPFKDTGKWCEDFELACNNLGHKIMKWYMWYTTCPKCAKKYGKNEVAIIAKIE